MVLDIPTTCIRDTTCNVNKNLAKSAKKAPAILGLADNRADGLLFETRTTNFCAAVEALGIHKATFLPQSFTEYTQRYSEFRPPTMAKRTQRPFLMEAFELVV